MEKKTLGSFLAALRKANGLTQRELAERLNVSDKAVSRWERDECAPDLTLIPIIAEIFDITADELLRGQRNSPDTPPPASVPEKTARQLARILEENRTRFLIRSLIALGTGLVGLIAAMICNLGFQRAYLGFFIGCIFYVVGGILETSFATLAFSAVKSEDFPGDALDMHRAHLRRTTRAVGLILGFLLVFTLPLLTQCGNAYWGLTGKAWFFYALGYGLFTAGLFLVGLWVYRGTQLRKAGDSAAPAVMRARKQRAMQKKTIAWVALVMVATATGQCFFNALVGPTTFADGIVFQNMDSFRVFAETPTANLEADYAGNSVPNLQGWDAIEYYDSFGNVVTEEDALTRYLFEEGNEDYKYIHRNESIAQISPSGDGHDFPVTVYTHRQWHYGYQIMNLCNMGFVCLYVLEILTGFFLCLVKCRKL